MDNLLDKNAIGNKKALIIYEQIVNDKYFSQKLYLALLIRMALFTIATVIFMALVVFFIGKDTDILSQLKLLFNKALQNIIVLGFCVMGIVIITAIIALYFYVLNELIAVWLDLIYKKASYYDTFIEDKIYIEDADSKYRIILMHWVDNKAEYKVSKEQYNLLEKGDKVTIILSSRAKIFLTVQI